MHHLASPSPLCFPLKKGSETTTLPCTARASSFALIRSTALFTRVIPNALLAYIRGGNKAHSNFLLMLRSSIRESRNAVSDGRGATASAPFRWDWFIVGRMGWTGSEEGPRDSLYTMREEFQRDILMRWEKSRENGEMRSCNKNISYLRICLGINLFGD